MEYKDIKIFREYRLKFYLNARHYVIFENRQSDTHPHTWEFALTILIRRKEFIEFRIFEEQITEFLKGYQDKVLNEISPFMVILPTLENIVDAFTPEFEEMIREVGGELLCVEGSEGPSRSYIMDLREQNASLDSVGEKSDHIISEIIDTILDDIMQ